MIIRNCVVEGIERIQGERKSDKKPFAFWKLHLMVDFPTYNGRPVGDGRKVLSCNVTDDIMEKEKITLGEFVDVYSRGQYVDYIGVSNA